MKSYRFIIATCLLLILPAPTFGQSTPSPVREVNVTSDSAPGWIPSETQDEQVRASFDAYFRFVDRQDFGDAYNMMSALNKNTTPIETFTATARNFHVAAGGVRMRKMVKITWTKDPPAAPLPGIYAAVDFVGKYDNVSHYCGYMIWYQASETSPFELMRIEENYIDDATFAQAKQDHTEVSADTAWQQISQYCPNYSAD